MAKPVNFFCVAPEAGAVSVVGDFNDWKPDAHPMVRQPDGSWWKPGLTIDDLQMASPYNTYVNTGLPPSPIANPGLDSLRAVAAPADSSYLYFRTACDGSGRHVFAETFEQQLQNACP